MDSLHEIHGLVKLEEYEEVKKAAATLTNVAVQGTSSQQEATDVSDNDYLSKLQS